MKCTWCQADLPPTAQPNTRIQHFDGMLSDPFVICSNCAEVTEVFDHDENGLNIIPEVEPAGDTPFQYDENSEPPKFGETPIPSVLFESDKVSHETRYIGMWLCYLCLQEPSKEITTTLGALKEMLAQDVLASDIYRLNRLGIIDYAEDGDHWTITLKGATEHGR